MRKLLLISFLMILVSASLVSADFSLSSDSTSYDACSGSTITVVTQVTGSGSFSVTGSGSAGVFTTTVPASFSLSDDVQNVYSYVNPPSRTDGGLYNLEVAVNDGAGSKSQVYEINVKDCHGSSLDVTPEKLACACVDTEYSITLENLGDFTETFELSVDGLAEEWTTLSVEELSVGAGEKRAFSAVVSPPCNVHGVYEVEFNAKAIDSLASATATSDLDIQPCYEYELGLSQDSFSLCENIESEFSLSIKNLGTANNTFKINTEPNWISADRTVNIDSGAEKTVKLTALPAFGTAGEFDLEVEVLSEKGSVKKSVTSDLNVEKCYGVSAKLSKSEENICDVERDYSYEIAVSNSGKLQDTVTLAVDGPEWASLEDKKVVLNPEGERTTNLNINFPSDVKKDNYKIKIKITSDNGAESEIALDLNVADEKDCYAPDLDVEEDSVVVGLEKGKTVSLSLENEGLDEATFIISLEGSAKKFTLINPEKVILRPGQDAELFLFLSPPLFTEEGEYNLMITAESQNVDAKDSEEIRVKVVEKLDESGKVVKSDDEDDAEGNFFARLFSRLISFFKNPLEGLEVAEEVDEEVEDETAEESEEVVEDEVEEEVVEEEVETEDVTEEEKEGFWSKIFSKAKPSEEVGDTEEEAEEEATEESEEVVEDEKVEEEKEGFWSKIFSKAKPSEEVEEEVAEEETDEEES